MSKKMTIAQFEGDLVGLQGSILQSVKFGELDLLFRFSYSRLISQADEIQPKLEKIQMYEPVKAALAKSETLAREAKYEEASDVILDINRALMRVSGTWDKMMKRYPPKT
jgi:hypothetical protein